MCPLFGERRRLVFHSKGDVGLPEYCVRFVGQYAAETGPMGVGGGKSENPLETLRERFSISRLCQFRHGGIVSRLELQKLDHRKVVSKAELFRMHYHKR